jgi:hypothetical protein
MKSVTSIRTAAEPQLWRYLGAARTVTVEFCRPALGASRRYQALKLLQRRGI